MRKVAKKAEKVEQAARVVVASISPIRKIKSKIKEGYWSKKNLCSRYHWLGAECILQKE